MKLTKNDRRILEQLAKPLPPGYEFRSVRLLSLNTEISRGWVLRTVRKLEAAGLIEQVRGEHCSGWKLAEGGDR